MAKKKQSILDQIIENAGGSVDKVAMAEATVSEFGGMEGIAKLLKAEFHDAPSGSTARATILRSIVELIRNASDKVGKHNWEDEVSEADLAAAVAEAVKDKR